MASAKGKQLLTVGVIASRIGVPIHRIEYLIVSRGIEPVARAGKLRVFNPGVVELLRSELRTMSATVANHPPILAGGTV